MELTLARCTLRPWRCGDAPSQVLHANNRSVWLNLRDRFPHPYTAKDADEWIAHAGAQAPVLNVAIVVDGAAVGGTGLELGTDVFRRSEDERRLLLAVPAVTRYLAYTGDIGADAVSPGVATLLRDLPNRMKDDSLPQGDVGEGPTVWRPILEQGTRTVELPSAPKDSASVCMTIDELEVRLLSVRDRHLSLGLRAARDDLGRVSLDAVNK